MNVFTYGQLTIVEHKPGYWHVLHGQNRLTRDPLFSVERAYAWADKNTPELTKAAPPAPRKNPEWGDDGYDYNNPYAAGQP